MIDLVKNFLFEYFWLPIIDQSVHYNVYNTVVYAVLFSILVIYLIFPLIKGIGIDFDKEFFVGMTPFLFLGGIARSLRDKNIIDTILLETPIIYLLLFATAIITLYISKSLEKREIIPHYHYLVAGTGSTLLITSLYLLIINSTVQYFTFFNFLIYLFLSSAVLSLITLAYDDSLFNYAFLTPIIAHFADAASTIVALGGGAEEKHVLANIFINNLGPHSMFLMKSIVIIPATYYIYKEFEGDQRNYYLFLITLLGVGLAIRNITSVTFD